MKGDFSRLTFNKRKHYTGVLHQQGRVWLDADWNELVQDRQYLLEQETIDIIGRCGVPSPGNAFTIAANPDAALQPDDFTIAGGPGKLGHLYVDGVLCQWDENASYLNQPNLPNPPRITMPTAGQSLTALVYAEVWQRLITFLEDPDIREVALAGPDTSTRIKNIVQVKVKPVPAGATCETSALPGQGQGTLTTLQPTDTQPLDPCRLPDAASFTGRENHLYRVEIHDGGDVLGASSGFSFRVPIATDLTLGALNITLSLALTAAQIDALQRSGAVVLSDDDGRMERIPLAAISTNGLTITLARGPLTAFLRSRNAAVTGGAARFKWSRDNAAFAVGVTDISADRKTLTLASLGRDQATALRAGDIVEISDDSSELGAGRGHLTYLTANPDPDKFTVSLADDLPTAFSKAHLILRRWDGLGSAKTAFSETTTPDMNLGDGVHIQFGGLDLRPGDYWNFAARTIDGSIEKLTDAAPNGIVRHFCKLAVVSWTQAAGTESKPVFTVLEDCRRIFPPLTELAEPGIHVTRVFALDANGKATPLENDTNVAFSRISGGIQVECDSTVDPASISRPTCYVTVEAPNPENASNTAGTPRAYQPLNLSAFVNAGGSVIAWSPTDAARTFMSNLPRQIPPEERGVLTRLTLKGNFIWDQKNPNFFLDGEVLGIRPPNSSSTLLRLPSGDKRRGGDFEMWFWLNADPTVQPLIFVLNAFPGIVRVEGLAELAGDLLLTGTGGAPTPAGTPVPLVNIQITFNVNVTSALLGTNADALLVIDDPTTLNTNSTVAAPLNGVGGNGLNFRGGAAPNTFIGRVAGNNSYIFTGVPIDPPGSNATRTLRFKNLRVNATQLGVSATGIPTQLLAFVSVSGAIALQISNPQAIAAFLQPGESSLVLNGPAGNNAGPFSFNRLNGVNTRLAADPRDRGADINFRLRYREGFSSAFKTARLGTVGLAQPGPQREASFDNAAPGQLPVTGPALQPGLGAVTAGTRFRALFTNVPAGVQIFVTTRDVLPRGTAQDPPDNPPPRAILIKSDAGGAGGGPGPTTPGGVPVGTGGATAGIPIDAIPIINGAGVAVWEWVSRDAGGANVLDQFEVGILLAAPAAGNQAGGASVGSAFVNMSFAPLSTIGVASAAAPVPRFIDRSSQQAAFSVTTGFVFPGGVGGILTGGVIGTAVLTPGRAAPQAQTIETKPVEEKAVKPSKPKKGKRA